MDRLAQSGSPHVWKPVARPQGRADDDRRAEVLCGQAFDVISVRWFQDLVACIASPLLCGPHEWPSCQQTITSGYPS
jgi:hypothetical protein